VQSEGEVPLEENSWQMWDQRPTDFEAIVVDWMSAPQNDHGAQPQKIWEKMAAQPTPVFEEVHEDELQAFGRLGVLLDVNTDQFDEALATEDGGVRTKTQSDIRYERVW
jgi:hypothetical protein